MLFFVFFPAFSFPGNKSVFGTTLQKIWCIAAFFSNVLLMEKNFDFNLETIAVLELLRLFL